MKAKKESVKEYLIIKVVVVVLLSIIVHIPAASGPFLYDDDMALVNNLDVQERTPLSHIWSHDYWGNPLSYSTSHKSYRPLTILLFRCMHRVWGNWAPAYHRLNMILHALVSVLFFMVCRKLLPNSLTKLSHFAAGVLFAIHPIHTETVCGIVSCADLLTAICYMSSLILIAHTPDVKAETKPSVHTSNTAEETRKSLKNLDDEGEESHESTKSDDQPSSTHDNCLRKRKVNATGRSDSDNETDATNTPDDDDTTLTTYKPPSWIALIIALTLGSIGLLFKEIGFSVLGIIIIYEIMQEMMKAKSLKDFLINFDRKCLMRVLLVLAWGIVVSIARMQVMGWQRPTFQYAFNHIPYLESKSNRAFNYVYLCWYNFALLLCPTTLCYDYSVGSIPEITSIWDIRNFVSFPFLVVCLGAPAVAVFYLPSKAKWIKAFIFGASLMIVPFIPSSNLFFTVGFVVAERILYLPSAGFIILLILLWEKCITQYTSTKRYLHAFMAVLVFFYFIKSATRSSDWSSKLKFFKANVDDFPLNPKIRYNWGANLFENQKYSEAIPYFKDVIEINPKNFGATLNLAICMFHLKMSRGDTFPRTSFNVLIRGDIPSVYTDPCEPVLGILRVLRTGYYTDKIEELLKRAIEINPYEEKGYAAYAKYLTFVNRTEEAVQTLVQGAHKSTSRLDKLLEAAKYMMQVTNATHVNRAYFHVLKKACQSLVISSRLGVCAHYLVPDLKNFVAILRKNGEEHKADRYEKQIAKIAAMDFPTLENYAKALSNTWSVEEAFITMMTYTEKDEINESGGDDIEIWKQAMTLFKNQRYQESKKYYEMYITAQPDNLNAKGQYGALLYQTGDPRGEGMLFNITQIDKDCNYHGAWLNLATIYAKELKFEKGIELLQICLDRLKQLPNTNVNLGKRIVAIMCQLGKHQVFRSSQLKEEKKEAEAEAFAKIGIKTLKDVLKMDPNNYEAQSALFSFNKT